jgi:hypothetical protein
MDTPAQWSDTPLDQTEPQCRGELSRANRAAEGYLSAIVAVVTQSEWETELRDLRADLGQLAEMLMRWRWHPYSDGSASVVDLLIGARGSGLMLSLYDSGAQRGDRPLVEVDVQPDNIIESIEQRTAVRVAGLAQPGHAVVVLVGDHRFWPVYPCTLGMRAQRL